MSGTFNDGHKTTTYNIKPPSKEFLSLSPAVRETIKPYLSSYPVKLGQIANALGVKVFVSTLPRGVSGQIGIEAGEFVIRVNRHEAKHRQRFTLAHELAHYLLHSDLIVAQGTWSENVLLRSGQPVNIEFEANRLASDLVIPTDLLVDAVSVYEGNITSEAIECLARKFQVSTSAMEIKLQLV